MFKVNEDKSIYVTRGDSVFFRVTGDANGEIYTFLPNDVVRFKVFKKKDCKNVVLNKTFTVTEETDAVSIILESKETKIGAVISKPTNYWYEIEHERNGILQTIVGYDDAGEKIFRVFPEGEEEV